VVSILCVYGKKKKSQSEVKEKEKEVVKEEKEKVAKASSFASPILIHECIWGEAYL